jgi:hypothetical protein
MIPVEQAQHITISVSQEPIRENTLWERIHFFLDGLFA